MKGSSISFLVDFTQLVNSLGAVDALVTNSVNPQYTTELMKFAQKIAEKEFNTLAAANAATGSIAHMYEWGTQGINKGRSNMRPNPMDPRARLWETTMDTVGMKGTMGFIFKPSIAIVPKPTVAKTGMSPDIIEKLADHVFIWKARVMEQGETVHIVPKNAKALLIPTPKGTTDKGFVMSSKPVNVVPGAKVAGNFTQFWVNYWESLGQETMEKSMVAQMELDFTPPIEAPARGTLKPPAPSVKASVKKKSLQVQKETKAKAKTRNRTINDGRK